MKQAGIVFALVTALSGGPTSGQRQSTTSIEFEDLVRSASVSGGQATRQETRGFGAGWSGNAQLFWNAPTPVDAPIRNWPHLAVRFVTPGQDTYEVILHYTSAPDFGTFRVFLDGQPRADIDAYSTRVAPQSRSLGNLMPGNHELLVTVFMKGRSSTGFSVGLDRIELRSSAGGAAPPGRLRVPQLPAPSSVNQPTAPPPAAQLNFAVVSGTTLDWTAKGGTDTRFDGQNPTAHFIWESPSSGKLAWRWQLSREPFPGSVSVSPPGLLAEQQVSSSRFAIELGKFLAGRTSPAAARGTIDFYIRLVAADGAQAVAASNVVVAHYLPGSDQSTAIVKDALEKEHERKTLEAALNAMSMLYSVEIVSFKPAMFSDPNRWGCVFIVKNPHAGTMGHPLFGYGPGEHCGASYKGQGHSLTPWDYITGWFKAYEIVSQFYDDAKAWTAQQFANTLPCGMMGKAADECKKYGEQLAGVAINVGLVAAGVPPSLPDLNEAAKGKAVDAGVGFTCASIESNGGKCSPELRAALSKAYGAGLDKLEKQLNQTTKEPGCGNAGIAHEHGREPLPCFGNYPDVEFRPADNAVYQPPMTTLRITRAYAGLPDLARSDFELRTWLRLDNRFPGGQIESYYKPVPPTNLSGELFAPATLVLPTLAMGQSATVILPLRGIKQYTFSSTEGGYAVHNGWCALYNGGAGPLWASVTCTNAKGSRIPCAIDVKKSVQMPKDGNCNIG